MPPRPNQTAAAREAKAAKRQVDRHTRAQQQQTQTQGQIGRRKGTAPAAEEESEEDEEEEAASDDSAASASSSSSGGEASESSSEEGEEEEAEGSDSDSDSSASLHSDVDSDGSSSSSSSSSDERKAPPRKQAAKTPAAAAAKRTKAPTPTPVPAPKPKATKAPRKRPHNQIDAEEDTPRAAVAATPAPAVAASTPASAVPQRSRGSTRVVRRPAAADDSPSEDEAAEDRARKRAKSGSVAPVAPSPPLLDPDELPDEWRCSANDALTFRLVRPAPEKDTVDKVEMINFHPHYTHQLWDEEEIVGYKKVKAMVAFTSGALYTYLNVEYESKCPDTQVADIQELIGSKLRGGFTTDMDDFKSHIHDPFTPPGKLLCEYTLPSVDHSFKDVVTYEVYHGSFSDPLLRDYHRRLQFFLLFFIDRSSFINDADPVWEVILLFQKRVCQAKHTTTYHIVGYTTLYKFLAYPDDWKMRLSQILILPPYQRAGHGQKLLQIVYQEAEARRMIEVNIEDPSPVFQLLRDLTDISLCRKHRFFEKNGFSESDPLESWDPEYAARVKCTLRITLSQVRRCYEIFKLSAVGDRHKQQRAMTAYRLEVKARLFRCEQEVLALYSHRPEERKEKLAEMYNELEQHYLAVIKKARLH